MVFLRLNDIDRATNAKCTVEQKQREEAKVRKDTGGEWDTKVNILSLIQEKNFFFYFFLFSSTLNQLESLGFTQNPFHSVCTYLKKREKDSN